MSETQRQRTVVCRLDELDDPDSRGVTVVAGERLQDVFIVRQGEQVFGYLNSCPHTGGPLDWLPDRFLNLDKDYIQCATHAALFRLENGECVSGPCHGARLTAVPVTVEAGEVILPGQDDPAQV